MLAAFGVYALWRKRAHLSLFHCQSTYYKGGTKLLYICSSYSSEFYDSHADVGNLRRICHLPPAGRSSTFD